MAEKIALDIQINTLNSAKSVKELKDGISNLTKELQNVDKGSQDFKNISDSIGNAKNKLRELNIDALNNAKSIGDLKNGIKDLTKELETLPEGSAEFQKTAAAIGNAKDKLGDLNQEVAQTTTKAGKFQAILGIGQQIAAGFQTAQSAMALFGDESEAVKKSLEKAQAAMQFVQGLKELEGIMDAFKNAKAVILDFGKSAMIAIRAVTAAIAANPIGALLTAIVALVAVIGILAATEDDETEALRENINERQKSIDAIDREKEVAARNAKFRLDLAKAQGKSEKELFEIEQDTRKKREKEIEKENNLYKEQFLQLNKLRKDADDDEQKDLVKQMNDLRAKIVKNNDEKIQLENDFQIKKATLATADIKKEEEKLKEQQAKDKEAAKQRVELQKELNKQLAQARIDSIDDDREKAKAQEIFNYEQSKKELETKFKGQKELNDLLFELEMKHKNALSEIDNNFNIAEDKKKKEREDKAKAEADKKREEELAGIKKDQADQLSEYETRIKTQQRLGEDSTALELEAAKYKLDTILNDENASYEQRLAAQEEYNAKVKELDDKAAEEKKAIKEAELNLISDSLKLASDMITFYAKGDEASQKKAFEINKKVQLAMATIDMYRGIMGAFESAMDSPLAGIFPAYPYIQAAMAGAYGLMNINKIAQTQYESASSGAAGGMEGAASGAGGAMSAPLQGGVNNTSTMLENLGQGQQEQKPIKAYVLQTDVASEDQKIKAIENKSKIE